MRVGQAVADAPAASSAEPGSGGTVGTGAAPGAQGAAGLRVADGAGGSAGQPRLIPATAAHDRRALMLMSIRDGGQRAALAQDIVDEIAIDIVEGRLPPGASLNSVDLARRFGTSRTPVREALAALESQGMVVVPPRRRPYVAKASLAQIRDVYNLRACLFSLVAELIVEECPREHLAELWSWQGALEEAARRGSVDDYFWHNVGFRLVEARLAGNEELQRILGGLGLRTLQFRHLSLSQPGRLARSVEDHRRLLLAYEDGDRATATAVTRTLIMAGYRAIVRSGVATAAAPDGSDEAFDAETEEGA